MQPLLVLDPERVNPPKLSNRNFLQHCFLDTTTKESSAGRRKTKASDRHPFSLTIFPPEVWRVSDKVDCPISEVLHGCRFSDVPEGRAHSLNRRRPLGEQAAIFAENCYSLLQQLTFAVFSATLEAEITALGKCCAERRRGWQT